MTKPDLAALVAVSRRYGTDPDWVIGGGGNTSLKSGNTMWVKASGCTLGTISADQFVGMDRDRLDAIWERNYPAETDAREEAAKEDLLSARAKGEEAKRPSVEALAHAILPDDIVIHTHPTLVNAIGCAADGITAARSIFGEDILWVPVINPGYVLAKRIHDEYSPKRHRLIMLQNHGLFVSGNTVADAETAGDDVEHAIAAALPPDTLSRSRACWDADSAPATGAIPDALPETAGRIVAAIKTNTRRLSTVVSAPPILQAFLANRKSFAPLDGALTPDHIVYAGHRPLWIESVGETESALARFQRDEGCSPKVAALRGTGVVGIGVNAAAADTALKLFINSAQIVILGKTFGGAKFLPPDDVAFIRNWEVERFRAQVMEDTQSEGSP